jgi:hypothetical protein
MVKIAVFAMGSLARVGGVVDRKWRLGWRVHGKETGLK